MKFIGLSVGIGLVVLLLGGFGWLAFSDVPVEQSQVNKTISNDRFFNTN